MVVLFLIPLFLSMSVLTLAPRTQFSPQKLEGAPQRLQSQPKDKVSSWNKRLRGLRGMVQDTFEESHEEIAKDSVDFLVQACQKGVFLYTGTTKDLSADQYLMEREASGRNQREMESLSLKYPKFSSQKKKALVQPTVQQCRERYYETLFNPIKQLGHSSFSSSQKRILLDKALAGVCQGVPQGLSYNQKLDFLMVVSLSQTIYLELRDNCISLEECSCFAQNQDHRKILIEQINLAIIQEQARIRQDIDQGLHWNLYFNRGDKGSEFQFRPSEQLVRLYNLKHLVQTYCLLAASPVHQTNVRLKPLRKVVRLDARASSLGKKLSADGTYGSLMGDYCCVGTSSCKMLVRQEELTYTPVSSENTVSILGTPTSVVCSNGSHLMDIDEADSEKRKGQYLQSRVQSFMGMVEGHVDPLLEDLITSIHHSEVNSSGVFESQIGYRDSLRKWKDNKADIQRHLQVLESIEFSAEGSMVVRGKGTSAENTLLNSLDMIANVCPYLIVQSSLLDVEGYSSGIVSYDPKIHRRHHEFFGLAQMKIGSLLQYMSREDIPTVDRSRVLQNLKSQLWSVYRNFPQIISQKLEESKSLMKEFSQERTPFLQQASLLARIKEKSSTMGECVQSSLDQVYNEYTPQVLDEVSVRRSLVNMCSQSCYRDEDVTHLINQGNDLSLILEYALSAISDLERQIFSNRVSLNTFLETKGAGLELALTQNVNLLLNLYFTVDLLQTYLEVKKNQNLPPRDQGEQVSVQVGVTQVRFVQPSIAELSPRVDTGEQSEEVLPVQQENNVIQNGNTADLHLEPRTLVLPSTAVTHTLYGVLDPSPATNYDKEQCQKWIERYSDTVNDLFSSICQGYVGGKDLTNGSVILTVAERSQTVLMSNQVVEGKVIISIHPKIYEYLSPQSVENVNFIVEALFRMELHQGVIKQLKEGDYNPGTEEYNELELLSSLKSFYDCLDEGNDLNFQALFLFFEKLPTQEIWFTTKGLSSREWGFALQKVRQNMLGALHSVRDIMSRDKLLSTVDFASMKDLPGLQEALEGVNILSRMA